MESKLEEQWEQEGGGTTGDIEGIRMLWVFTEPSFRFDPFGYRLAAVFGPSFSCRADGFKPKPSLLRRRADQCVSTSPL